MALVNQWTDSYALAAGFVIPDPTISTRQVAVANTAGNWLVCTASWHTGAGAQTIPTVSVGDDVHNYWVPLARVSGAGGGVAIWVAPNARAASRVYIAPTDYVTGLSISVMEHNGLGNYLQVGDRKTATATGTSANLTLLAPPSQALAIVAGGSDNATATLTSATAGWTSGTAVSGTNGVDLTSDTRLLPRYQTTTGSVSVTYTTSTSTNIVAVGVTVLTAAAAPAQPNPHWPRVVFEVGFGSGSGTPRDQITWTAPTKRLLAFSTSRGRQYELSQLQAGETNLQLRNNDAALNPANTGSPYYPNITDMTPARVTATWQGRTYGVWHHLVERWPQSWKDAHWGEVNATAVGPWAALTTELPNIASGEILLDAPYGYWPMSDPDEATVGSNIAPNNAEPFRQVVSKYGPGAAKARFGVDSGLLIGSPNLTAWEQRGLTSLQITNGISLQCGPGPAFPPVAPGWTVEFWARLDPSASQPASNLTLFSVKNGNGTLMSIYVDQASQCATISDYDPITHARTNTISAVPVLTGTFTHFCLTFNTTGWQLYVNAQLAISRVTSLDTFVTWLTACGAADETFHGRMINGSFAHFAVFGRKLPYGRIVAHYWSAWGGNENDSADQRINKLLAIGGSGIARSISYTADSTMVPASGIEGQDVATSVEEVAASDGGGLYEDGLGYICFTSKPDRYNRSPQYILGDRPDLGEIPYLGDIVFDRDPAQVSNSITVTQAHYGRKVSVSDSASITQRGVRTRDATTHVANPLAVADHANYLLLRYKQPELRISQITLDPASNPAIWPTALGIECGDVVTVNRRPIGGVLLTGRFEVLGVSHRVDFAAGEWKTTLNLAPADPFFFRLDDATYGVLDGPGVLGW
ncbi:LamG domain-containing protein [Streptosporangium sp. NBC_01810]|uniref:LamG-like jellyroll fold domain-containing protein n=1 Tax=Streptosporangium sp. NBC_01810 TaxID=2975951 RepID=UPI002DDC66CF|nr:LamG-like jellyroll fold domain-containing protein [Streptosporangium sp. NBC_01810]WSA27415.1 LamG domain-containing protein [Streptosporangium sp. NBC_01810]